MEQNKKQTTLFDVWKKKPSTTSVSNNLGMNINNNNADNIEGRVVIPDDDNDIETFEHMPFDENEISLAMELSMREYKVTEKPCPASGNYEQHASNNVTDPNYPSTSKPNNYQVESTDNLVKKIQVPLENLDGFDVNSGQTWIYPTNYTFREYQFNIVQTSLFKNSMVVLPTGLGKTFIAAVIMYNFYRWYPRGKVVFMAPTRPLVNQQIESCFKVMGIPQEDTEVMIGNEASEKRKCKWLSKRVFFVTPQIISNDISRGVCPVNLLKCLVIDEAHKAQGNHSYCEVIRGLIQSKNSQFRVIGLSATPGGDMKAVESVLKNLLISHVELRFEDSPDIVPYTHVRTVQKVVVKMDKELMSVKEKFLKVLKHVLVRLEQKNAINRNTNPETLSKFGVLKLKEAFVQNPPTNLTKATYNLIHLEFLICISLYHAYDLLDAHGTRSFYKYMKGNVSEENTRVGKFLENNPDFKDIFQELRVKHESNEKVEKGFFPYGHPKLKKLEEIVLEHFKKAESQCDSQSTRVMIFSNYRESVEEIVQMLELHEPFVRAMAFIGQNNQKSKGISQKMQLQVVESFRRGGYNTLVSTCVGEEGLDIGEIDLIICYDAHKSPIRLVQRIGRTGRKRDGRVISLVTEGREDRKYNQGQFNKKRIDRALTSEAVQQYLYQNSPRMVPIGIDPECHKIFMTIKSFDPKNAKKPVPKKSVTVNRKNSHSNSITDMFGKINTSKKQKLELAFLNNEELAEWNENYKHLEGDVPSLPNPTFLSIPNKTLVEENNRPSKPIYDLSKWISWQITRQFSFKAGHSNKTEVLIHMLKYIENLTIFPENNPYENDYCNYLDMKDVNDSDEGDIETAIVEKQTKKVNLENRNSIGNVLNPSVKRKRQLLLIDDDSDEERPLDTPIMDIARFNDILTDREDIPHGDVAERNISITDMHDIPAIQLNDTSLYHGNHKNSFSNKSLLEPAPVLDFDFDKPLSLINVEEFTSLFGEKVDKGNESDVSDDGYKSDDERFLFLNLTKVNLANTKCNKFSRSAELLPPIALNHLKDRVVEINKKNSEFNLNDLDKSLNQLIVTKISDEQLENKALCYEDSITDISFFQNIRNSLSHENPPADCASYASVQNKISNDLADDLGFTRQKISPVEPQLATETNIISVRNKAKPMFDLDSSTDSIDNPVKSHPKELVVNETLSTPMFDLDSSTESIDNPVKSHPNKTLSKPMFDLDSSTESIDNPVKSHPKELVVNETISKVRHNSENIFDDENIFILSDDELRDINVNQTNKENLISVSEAKSASEKVKSNVVSEKIKSKTTADNERNSSEDMFSDDIILDLEILDGSFVKRCGSTSTPKAVKLQKPKIVCSTRNILQEASKPSCNLDGSSDIFADDKSVSEDQNQNEESVQQMKELLEVSSNVKKAECDDAASHNSNLNVAYCVKQYLMPNFDLDIDDEVFSLTPEEYDYMKKDCPKTSEKDATMTGLRNFSSSDEKESPIRFKRKNSALILRDDDDKDPICDNGAALQKKFKESSIWQEKSGNEKRSNRKVNADAARRFINEEAEVSDPQSDDEIEVIGSDSYDQSFVNDSEESSCTKSPTSMMNVYMQSVKSPARGNKFKLQFDPKNSNSMIFSQMVESDVSDYEEDSFCVRNYKEDNVVDVTPIKKRNKKGPRRIMPIVSSSDEEKSMSEPLNKCHIFARPKDVPLPSKIISSRDKPNESSSWLSKIASSNVLSSSSLKSTIRHEHGKDDKTNVDQPSCSSNITSYVMKDNVQVIKKYSNLSQIMSSPSM